MKTDPRLLDQLKKVDLFASLSERQLVRVVESGRLVTHSAGHEVIEEGRASVGFHLVVDGTARISVAGDDREDLAPEQYFGEISLLDGKPRSASVTAGQEGLTTFSVGSFEFNAMLAKHPEMNKDIIAVLCARLREERSRAHTD